jgi:hypothetical protein
MVPCSSQGAEKAVAAQVAATKDAMATQADEEATMA